MNDFYYNPAEIMFSLFGAIIPLAIFLASAYYLSKKTETASILLTAGSFISLFSTVSFIIMPQFVDSNFYSSGSYSIISSISNLGSFAFAIGFVLLIKKKIKQVDY